MHHSIYLLILLLSISIVSWAEDSRPDCFIKLSHDGYVEKYLYESTISLEKLDKETNKIFESLDSGGEGWRRISPELVYITRKAILDATAAYNNSAERVQVEKNLITALKKSKEFGSLDTRTIEQVADSLLRGNQGLEIPMLNTAHHLYHLLAATEVNSSPQFVNRLLSLQNGMKQKQERQNDVSQLKSMLNNGYKGMTTVADPQFKYVDALLELRELVDVPHDLALEWAKIAKEYQDSNYGNLSVLTEGHRVATEKFNRLVESHPFFVKIDNRARLQRAWSEATTVDSVNNLIPRLMSDAKVQVAQAKVDEAKNNIEFLSKFMPFKYAER